MTTGTRVVLRRNGVDIDLRSGRERSTTTTTTQQGSGGGALLVTTLVFLAALWLGAQPVAEKAITPTVSARTVEVSKPMMVDPDVVLWLARGAYTETKRPEEAVEIMWVIRRRVEAGYRGERTYWGVLHDHAQFSAFLEPAKRKELQRLTADFRSPTHPNWPIFLEIARQVVAGEADSRLDDDCLHFFAPKLASPAWATSNPIAVGRFEFHCGVR